MLSKLWAPLPRKRARGGWRQRQRQLEIDEAEDRTSSISYLAAGHLLDWCDGLESASKLRFHMHNAIKDGFHHPMITRLSDISVESDQHCHAGLCALLDTCEISDLITEMPAGGLVTHIVLPSTMLKMLHSAHPRQFERHLGATKHVLEAFWKGFTANLRRQGEELSEALRSVNPADYNRLVPLTVHEDAGPCTKRLSAPCVSFSGLLGQGDEKVAKYVCFSSLTRNDSNDNNHEGWKCLLKDLDDLLLGMKDGEVIALNEDGQPWLFILLFAKADEECRVSAWGLVSYNAPDEVCPECLADRCIRPFTNLLESAEWRPTESLPLVAYLARCREPLHPLLESKYVTPWFCFADLMHMMDCKGVAALVYGAILSALMKLPGLGPNRKERLATINEDRLNWYRANPRAHRLPKILMNNLVSTDKWFDLCGPGIKSAMTRTAAQWFDSLCQKYLQTGSEDHRALCAVSKHLVQFYKILYTAPMFPSPAERARFRKTCLEFGANYQWLRDIGRRNGDLIAPVRTKVHKMQHLPRFAGIINPRYVQCYGEESLIGTTVQVWKKCMRGRYDKQAQRNVLLKRITGLLLRYEL